MNIYLHGKRRGLFALLAMALLAGGCSSRPKPTAGVQGAAANEASAPASGDSGTHVDVMCIADRISNPPESFHYSFRYTDAANTVRQEADITPQVMDITVQDQSGSHSYHGVRSDETSWGSAVLDLSSLNVTVMSSRLDLLNNSSAIARQGRETINGYETVKYAIDTGRASSADQKKYETLFGKGSFEKGTLWAPADGCAVKLLLDEGVVRTSGNVEKVHYEIARLRK